MEKIKKSQIAKFIKEEKLLDIKSRVRIIKIVHDYFGDKVDGNDINKVLMEVFRR
jgi:hypothetical protein